MAQNRESLSEISRRRTSWILFVLGLVVLMLFLAVYCSVRQKKQPTAVRAERPEFKVENTLGDDSDGDQGLPNFDDAGTRLVVTPPELAFENVVLGSEAEGILVLRAENGPLVFAKKELVHQAENGFELSGSCMEMTHLDRDEECLLKVSWHPMVVQTVQNTLTIEWREDNARVFDNSRTQVQLKAGSTDSKECVCCEIEKEKEPKVPRKVIGIDGKERDLKPGEKIVEDVIVNENNEIVGIVEPERVALGLKNEYLGRVTDRRTVENKDGATLGRLLGDDTLVDSDFKILGGAIPLVSVLDAQGVIIGKMIADDDGVRVVDAEGKTIGTPRVDMTVVDKTGTQIGMIRPWGAVLDLSGNYFGIILPTGAVVNQEKKTVGYIQQNGFVTSESGALVGGAVPRGIAVGTGCRSYGTVALNGQVKDAYGQVVGRVMLDGGVVDSNFNEIGRAVNQGLVVDMKGGVVGFVNSEGKAVDGRGMLMGCVAPNGTVAASKTMIGGVLQKGHVVGNSCSVLGSVYPNGRVMSPAVQDIGSVRSDGYVLSPAKKVIGSVVPHGTVLAEGCRLVGTISVTGQILNEKNMSVGCINMQKQALDADGKEIGKITPTGPMLAADGSLIGRVRYDGRIIDKKGKVIDCASPEGEGVVQDKGVILDENGMPTAWTALAGKCFNERNEEIGTVAFNGWVSDKQGRVIGFMPPDGTIFSPTGAILGQYNRLMGAVLDTKGDNLGRVMPDWTVLDVQGTKILGALIAQNTTFTGLDGAVLGSLDYEGQVLDENKKVVGRVVADGSLYNADNTLIGGALSSGVVLSAAGKQIGWANSAGDVLSKGTRIANVLPNGLAVTPDNRVLGRVWMPMSVIVSARGVIGTVVPKAENGNATSYQAAGYDKMGNYLGVMSPFGVLLGADGRLGGLAAPISMVLDLQHRFIGWIGFNGQVLNPEAKVIGQLIQNGLVVNTEGSVIGYVVRKGTVVNATGEFVGRVGPDGAIYNGSGKSSFFVEPEGYFTNDDFSSSVRLLPNGLAMSAAGKVLGWTVLDGHIMDSEHIVGVVSLDNRVLDADGKLLAGYVALGAPSVQEDEKMCGVVTESGSVVASSGRAVGSVVAPDYAVQNNTIIGRIRTNSLFVREFVDNDLVGVADLDSLVYKPNTAHQTGSLMMNGLMVDASKKIVAGVIPTGFAISTNLKALGHENFEGSIWLAGKAVGSSSGIGIVSQNANLVTGGVFEPETVIDKNGLKIGQTNALANVLNPTGKNIASRMAFYSALTPETTWIGGPLKTGAIIDDYAHKVGTVSGDGTIVNAGIFKGRVLSDGSAAGVSERAVYNSMPYVGHIATQGVPMGYNDSVLGRTTIQGDLIDASDKIIYQTLDDGTILGKERPLEGIILSLRPAVSYHDEYLGVFDGNGKIFAQGEELGQLAANGALVATPPPGTETAMSKLKEAGGLIPESLIVNDTCKVIGQPTYTGEVIDGQGNTVARVKPTLYAKDPQGNELGRSVRYGPITSFDSKGVFIGRTLSDSTVVDPDGVNIGCARIDKILVDSAGNELGRLRNRGPVFGLDKKMFGRVDAMGRVVGVEGKVIGVIGGRDKDIAYDFNGKEIGWMADKEDRLIFNPDGTLDVAIGRDGWVKDARGEILYKLDQETGKIYDKWGNEIGSLDGGTFVFLYDMENKVVGQLIGCDLFKLPSKEKMGALLANGEIRDDNNEMILSTTADGRVYNPDGTQFGRFAGVGLDLRRCGLSPSTGAGGGAGHKINIGGQRYDIDENTGMIVNPESGEVVGGWNPSTGQPYLFDTKRPERNPDRPPPPTPVGPRIPTEAIENIIDVQTQRRLKMKERMSEQGSLVLPGYKVEEMAQTGVSDDWSSVGTAKSNVSTWPVDMSHVLLADKAIPAVLVRSIDSRYPSVPVTAIVERHIYAEAGRNILIPAGSRLIGQLQGSGMDFGRDQAAKIDIAWKRLIRPDGAAFKFEAVSGDAQGRGGVAAYLDLQLFKKLALPLVSSLGEGVILKLTEWNEKQNVATTSSSGSGSTDASSGNGTETAESQTRKMFIQNFRDIWDELMEMAGEVPNILYVPAGTRLTAFASEDLWLRSDKDPPEKPSNATQRSPNANTYVAPNDSWVRKRGQAEDEEPKKPDKKQPTYEQGGYEDQLSGDGEEPVYAPEDIDDRTVQPVSRQTPEKPVYF